MRLTANNPRLAPRTGRPLKRVVNFSNRKRFVEGCRVCENLQDYNCIMPYHEPAPSCATYQPHCTCRECW